MLKITNGKMKALQRLSTDEGVINALAIDQRGALKQMFQATDTTPTVENISRFKELVSEELTPYVSAILLDPEFGIPAANQRDNHAGLIFAYEKTGYDTSSSDRLPDLLSAYSVERLKQLGADAIKFLLYYDVDGPAAINQKKQVVIERLGNECAGADLPFYLELLAYDVTNGDLKSSDYVKQKPRKVIEMMKEFSDPRYQVDVLKVEVPVDMAFVDGFSNEKPVFSKDEAMAYFKAQSDATDIPYIFLSAGVSAKLFQETLRFAKASGAQFNGLLCGRATWKDALLPFVSQGESAARTWLQTKGKTNVTALNEIVKTCAKPWKDKVSF